ncbi:chitin deacetylase 1 [Phascolomyces articulosus]|uniref:Chitin deacetylase 1 n=1 Tax=Phascolomyces articulosus TaxID=60185 RepID=A0AAD5KBY9_9FUNG|nr:chitin deacetylase 1 [Phascolomyces articulosus]
MTNWKVAIATATAFLGAQAVTTNYTSSTDPTKIEVPDIPQTTSYDVNAECQYYDSPFAAYDKASWPTTWEIATSNNMNTSKEFTDLYNSIDWTKVPNIQPRKLDANGGLDMTTYNVPQDTDCWWSASGCMTPKAEGINADIYECPEPETLGLTFDDGPNCSHNAFYDFLLEKKQKASMFYIGSNVLAWPYGALRGVKDGHHIAGHTWSHQLMTTLTNKEVLAELYYTTKAIKYVTGLTPLYWRPAQGDLDDRVRWIATQLNLTAILWNIDTDDWAAGTVPGITAQTVDQNYKNFIEMGKNGTFANSGALILSHEINNQTMDFAMQHYDALHDAYDHVIDVATCMNISNPYVEQSITFPTFEQYAKEGAGSATGSGVSPAGTDGADSGAFSVHSLTNGPLFIAALFAVLVFA